MYYDPEEHGYLGGLLGNGDHRIPRDAYRPGKHIRPQLRFAMQRAGMSEEEYECTYIKRREGGDASDEADAWFGNTMEYRFTREYAWGCVDITVIAHYSMEDPDWWGDGYMISAWPEGFYDDEDSDDDVDDCVCFAYNEDYYTMEPGEQERIRAEAKAWAAQERKKAETEVRALLKKLEEEYEEIGWHRWNPATFEFID